MRRIRQTGIIGVGIDEGDSLLAARVVIDRQEVLIGTAQGMSIRFSVDDVRPTGRDTRGVRGIDLGPEDDDVDGQDKCGCRWYVVSCRLGYSYSYPGATRKCSL